MVGVRQNFKRPFPFWHRNRLNDLVFHHETKLRENVFSERYRNRLNYSIMSLWAQNPKTAVSISHSLVVSVENNREILTYLTQGLHCCSLTSRVHCDQLKCVEGTLILCHASHDFPKNQARRIHVSGSKGIICWTCRRIHLHACSDLDCQYHEELASAFEP